VLFVCIAMYSFCIQLVYSNTLLADKDATVLTVLWYVRPCLQALGANTHVHLCTGVPRSAPTDSCCNSDCKKPTTEKCAHPAQQTVRKMCCCRAQHGQRSVHADTGTNRIGSEVPGTCRATHHAQHPRCQKAGSSGIAPSSPPNSALEQNPALRQTEAARGSQQGGVFHMCWRTARHYETQEPTATSTAKAATTAVPKHKQSPQYSPTAD
jgi:hypothetical protein